MTPYIRPRNADEVMAFYGSFMGNAEFTSIRLKEFLRVAVARAIGCSEYCTNLRVTYARDLAGVTEEDVAKVRNVNSPFAVRLDPVMA